MKTWVFGPGGRQHVAAMDAMVLKPARGLVQQFSLQVSPLTFTSLTSSAVVDAEAQIIR